MTKSTQDLIVGAIALSGWVFSVYLFARYLPEDQSFMCVIYALPVYYLLFYLWVRFVALESEITFNCIIEICKKPIYFMSVSTKEVEMSYNPV